MLLILQMMMVLSIQTPFLHGETQHQNVAQFYSADEPAPLLDQKGLADFKEPGQKQLESERLRLDGTNRPQGDSLPAPENAIFNTPINDHSLSGAIDKAFLGSNGDSQTSASNIQRLRDYLRRQLKKVKRIRHRTTAVEIAPTSTKSRVGYLAHRQYRAGESPGNLHCQAHLRRDGRFKKVAIERPDHHGKSWVWDGEPFPIFWWQRG